jgi:hypothetical protein
MSKDDVLIMLACILGEAAVFAVIIAFGHLVAR